MRLPFEQFGDPADEDRADELLRRQSALHIGGGGAEARAQVRAAANKPMVTNDNHILAHGNAIGIGVMTPRAFLERYGADLQAQFR